MPVREREKEKERQKERAKHWETEKELNDDPHHQTANQPYPSPSSWSDTFSTMDSVCVVILVYGHVWLLKRLMEGDLDTALCGLGCKRDGGGGIGLQAGQMRAACGG